MLHHPGKISADAHANYATVGAHLFYIGSLQPERKLNLWKHMSGPSWYHILLWHVITHTWGCFQLLQDKFSWPCGSPNAQVSMYVAVELAFLWAVIFPISHYFYIHSIDSVYAQVLHIPVHFSYFMVHFQYTEEMKE